MKKNRTLVLLLAISLALILAGSFFANRFHTSQGAVEISRISFDTDKGTLSGLLYLPRGASDTAPRPAVIVTHGYLNSAEMQDANAIELSRRGFVVLALDMYDHGHSKAKTDVTGAFFSFWPTAMWDAAQYMYDQPFVAKDAAGNGLIGVTGHSMGGFSSSMAVWEDEKAFAVNGYRKIAASLTMGSDYQWSAYLGLTPEVAAANSGGRILGKLAAQFDEFFFNPDGHTGGTVMKKNYVATTSAKVFLGQEAPEAATWYETADGGKRIIYQPYEIHPWNHFSLASTGHAIEFYQTAFAGQQAALTPLPETNQTWRLKEWFELLALAGFLLMIVPLALLLVQLPFLSRAMTELRAVPQGERHTGGSLGSLAALLFAVFLPALFFPAIMDKNVGSDMLMGLFAAGVLLGIVGLVGLIRAKAAPMRIAALAVLAAGAFLAIIVRVPTFVDVKIWSAPTVNQIAYWALISVCFSLLFMGMSALVTGEKRGLQLRDYGVTLNPAAIAASLIIAALTVILAYAVLFLVDALWLTDFRVWTFAFKTFDPGLLTKVLPYLAPFFLYYLVGGAAIFHNTNHENMRGIKGYLLAIILNAGGIAVYLAVHYGMLIMTGTAAYPSQSLSSILLFALVPTLMIAAVFTRALYKRTGNIWLPAFLNALLMTIMTIANTTVYFR